MKIATVPSKNRKQLIIIVILLLGIPLVVFASLQITQWITKASAESKPLNVLFTNVGTQEFTVSWVTDTPSTGSVIPIINNQDGTPLVDTRGTRRRETHHITQRALEPNTNYNFIILSGEDRYGDDGSDMFSFKTPPVSPIAPTVNPVSGSVNGVSNEDAVVFISTMDKDVYAVSSVVSKGGSWNINLSSLRKMSDGSYIVVEGNDKLVILVVAGTGKGAFLEGTYGELFDSNGVLKEVYTLNVESMDNPYSKLSTSQKPSSVVTVPTTPVIDDLDITPLDLSDYDEPIEPVKTDRRFRIVTHVQWTDMTTVEGLSDVGAMREESVEVVNVTDTGFTVIWLSRQKESGYIKYGTSRDSLTHEVSDERDGITTRREYYVHYVPVTRLQPDMDYFFEIYSGEKLSDNEGQKYLARTFSNLSSPPPFDSIAGSLGGMPEHGEAIVVTYIQDMDELGSLGKSAKIASLVDQRGKWIVSISDSRTEDGLKYFEYTSDDSVYFNILTTVPVETHTEQAGGIGSRDVEILLEGKSVLGVDSTEIELLSNYGILGYSSGLHLPSPDVDPIEQDYQVISSTGVGTPKTGISDNLVYVFILSLILVVTPLSLYIIRVTKKRRKGTMIKSL